MSDCQTLATKVELLELEDKILKLLKQKIDVTDRPKIVHDGANAGEKLVAAGLGFGTVGIAGQTINNNQKFLASLQQQVKFTKTTIDAINQQHSTDIQKIQQYQGQQNVALQNNIDKKANLTEIKNLQNKVDYDKNQYIKEINALKTYLGEKPSKADLIAQGKEILAKQAAEDAQLKIGLTQVEKQAKNTKDLLENTTNVANEASNLAKANQKNIWNLWGKLDDFGNLLVKLSPLLALLNLVGFAADIINVLTVWTFIDSLNKQITELEKTIYSIDKQLTALYSIAAGQKSLIALLQSQLDNTTATASAALTSAGYAQNTANGALNNASIAQTAAQVANEHALEAAAAAEQAYAMVTQLAGELAKYQASVKQQFEALKGEIESLSVQQTLSKAEIIALKKAMGDLELTLGDLYQKQQKNAAYLQVAAQVAKEALGLAKKAIDLALEANNSTSSGGASVALKGEIQKLADKITSAETKFAQENKDLYLTITKANETLKGELLEKTTKYTDTKVYESQQEFETLNEQQVKEIQKSLEQNTLDPKIFTPLLAIPVIDALLKSQDKKLDQITDNTDPSKSKCLAPIYVPPVGAAVNKNLAATNVLQGVTITQSGFIQKSVNNVGNVVGAVNNKIGTFIPNGGLGGAVSRLYNFLAIDRWLNMINTALLLHNALMLSRSLTETAVSAIGNVLNFTGIKFQNAAGEEEQLSEHINHNLENFAKHVLGTDNYTELTTNWKKANRIYQATANILSTVRGMIDTLRDLGELAINNTGRIGNALRRAGGIFEKEGIFPEVAKPASKFQKFHDNYTDAIEGAENIFSSVDSVTSNVVSLKEEKEAIKTQKEELTKAIDDWKKDEKTNNDVAKSISSSPEIENKDLIKPEA